MPTGRPVIPDSITVHLGSPGEAAANVTLSFPEYIMNVASSEIYPTWPENALRANIYAQISFALNRVYTEYYRSRGYDFDITNDTQIDQSFVYGRDIFSNIREIVNEIFNSYLRRPGNVEPLFAQYCNGTTVTCPGLSQWGTVSLANQGYTPFEILTYYYGENLEIVRNVPVGTVSSSVPDFPLRTGSGNDAVRVLQIRLNRISRNYPSIPKIVETDGIFSYDTEEAVIRFQEIFNLTPDGVVGQATWYAVERIYAAVSRLNELDSEGIQLEEISQQFLQVLTTGSTGVGVSNLQYYLNYLSAFYATIPQTAIDGIFGESTRAAVIAFQNTYGLTPDGVVGEATWNALTNAYRGIVETIPLVFTEGNVIPFPGVPLRLGAESEDVRVLQEYLNRIAQTYPAIPTVNPTGYYGTMTQASVTAFQRQFGLPATGVTGALTWDAIASTYSDLYNGDALGEGQYPGAPIG